MLGVLERTAVKAVLVDICRGVRVEPSHWPTLIGVGREVLERIANEYPNLRNVSLEQADLAIHNGLNLYVNGLSISREDWQRIGTTLIAAEKALELWQREV